VIWVLVTMALTVVAVTVTVTLCAVHLTRAISQALSMTLGTSIRGVLSPGESVEQPEETWAQTTTVPWEDWEPPPLE
jgi:hypothetical protein